MARFMKGAKVIHALTNLPVTVVNVKPGNLVTSYDVRDGGNCVFDAMEGELSFPPAPKVVRRWEDEDDEDDD